MSDDEGFFGPMDDINSLPNKGKKEKTVIKKTRRGDGDKRRKQQANKNMIRRVANETFHSVKKQLKKSNKNKKNDKVGKVLESIRKHNEKVSKTPSPPELEELSAPKKLFYYDSDSDDDLFNSNQSVEILDPRVARMMVLDRQNLNKPAQFQYRVLKKHTGGSKTRKKFKRFRNNFRKNKISRKYIMLKQCGGGKAKMGSKSKPYSSKRKAMRSRRRVCYYKKKGRTLKLKKKSKKSKKKSRRRRRR
jgi:hypothetical protein